MRRKIRSLALALVALCLCAVTAFGSGDTILVNLSYLTGTYREQLASRLAGALNGLERPYEDALARLESSGSAGGFTAADVFTPLYPCRGETVTLSAGSGLLWISGSATADAMLLDATDGAELPAGRGLAAGHRYLVEGEVTVTASALSACAAQGYYRTTATGTAPAVSPFRDVSTGDWFFDPVMYVVERGLFNGTSGNTFSPLDTMDRSMVVTVLYRLAGSPAIVGENPFTDVENGVWYTNAILWAAQNGISASAAGAFHPAEPVPREEIALMFFRFAALQGLDTAKRADLAAFSDQGNITPAARESMEWAVAAGIIQGNGSGRLNPGDSATRCEVATLFQRLDAMVS